MAKSDETFDPNDLDSIDALLDEAELEAVDDSSNADNAEVDLDEQNVGLDEEIDNSADELPEVEESDDLLDSLDDLVAEAESKPEVALEPEAIASSPSTSEPKLNKAGELANTDDFLEKRASAQATKNSNLTAEDMDSIKKLIIIFGSVLSVLILVGIGIGVWSALAASSAGVKEETITLIESIKVASEHNGSKIETTEKTVKSVEKKLDAINFQLERLAEDIGELGMSKKASNETIDPLGLGALKPAHEEAKHNVAPQASHTTAAPAKSTTSNPDLMKKVSSVNSKLIKAQRRIDEVNTRVKKIQSQYQAMLFSIKTVEKQVLLEQAEKAEKMKKQKESQGANRYQYSSPDAVFYDQSVGDSYP